MEAAQLKINENFPMASLMPRVSQSNCANNQLPVDPWLSAQLTSTPQLAALSGFLSPYMVQSTGQGNPAGIHGLTSLASLSGLMSAELRGGGGPGLSLGACPTESDDPRSTSIVSLRLKAREHMENMGCGNSENKSP
ncbi:hypothetical protein LSH36_267g03105 [Paralvinella palmiformis]|uniref:OAR domain-containing protein n=1 Tax=Paralvinella palmiformis TaxID=53620 RepID=A0AAD9JJT3_9ANNE|nr:hypothetical protein LSH36_267g03105 [Paralvinella palmiformis]